MGVIRWLHSIDPEVWERACSRITSSPPRNNDEARRFLEDFGRSADTILSTEYDNFGDVEQRPVLLTALLERAVAEETWDMDKTLDYDLGKALKYLPEGRIVHRQLVNFGGMRLETPDVCWSTGEGFLGAFDSQEVESFLPVVTRYERREDIDEIACREPKKLLGVFPRRNRAQIARDIFACDGNWDFWQIFREAILKTHERRHYLGMGMST